MFIDLDCKHAGPLLAIGLLSLTACSPAESESRDAQTSTPDAVPGTPDGPAGTPDGGTPQGRWRKIALPDDQSAARVTGIQCTSRDACVITTDVPGDDGKVLAATDRAVGATLVDGVNVAGPAHVLGSVGFIGLDRTRHGLVARANVSGAYVSAGGDVTKATSWSIVGMGKADGDTFGLNAQEALQAGADGRWLFINRRGFVYESTTAPADSTAWTRLWSPTAVPAVPADFEDLFEADPTLCESDVSTGRAPVMTQNVFISQDLALLVHPAGGLNQLGSASPGVCVSTDRGKRFHQVPFAGLPSVDTPGPIAVTCLDTSRCFAWNGLNAQTGSAYLYYSTNTAMGAAATWTRATLPAFGDDDVEPKFLFFAPDGMNGWLGGARESRVMLLRTSDGGHTFTDVTSSLQGVTTERLHSGFALDADSVWLGGENGLLLFTESARQ